MGGSIGTSTTGEETELRVAATEPESRVPTTHVEWDHECHCWLVNLLD